MRREPIYVPAIFLVASPFDPAEDDPAPALGEVIVLPPVAPDARFGERPMQRLAGRIAAFVRRRPIRGRSVSVGAAVLVTPEGVVRRLPNAPPARRWTQLQVLAAVPPLPSRAVGWRHG